MFDIAWSELFLTAVVALVVIGPKDLPKAMLMLGRAIRVIRQMTQSWRQQFEQLTYEVERAAEEQEARHRTPAPAQEPAEPSRHDS